MGHFRQSLLFAFTAIVFCVKLCKSIDSEFTVEVVAGKEQCFYQGIVKGSTYEFEYQVIEGGEMDINFMIKSPSGVIILTDIQKQDAVHRLQAEEEGDFMFCLDNKFSHFSNKLVFFEMVTPDADPSWNTNNFPEVLEENVLEMYEMKMEDFKIAFDNLKGHLDKSQHDQNRLRSYELRDRSIAESNFDRVNWWSAVQLIVMLTTSFMQVVMIRSLFEDRSKVAQIFKIRT